MTGGNFPLTQRRQARDSRQSVSMAFNSGDKGRLVRVRSVDERSQSDFFRHPLRTHVHQRRTESPCGNPHKSLRRPASWATETTFQSR